MHFDFFPSDFSGLLRSTFILMVFFFFFFRYGDWLEPIKLESFVVES